MKLLRLFIIGSIATLTTTADASLNQVFSSNSKVDAGNLNDGLSVGTDTYTMYTGNGAACSGWPGMDKWISFEAMWQANLPLMSKSCSNIYPDIPNDSPTELQAVQNAIKTFASQANIDHRLILAIVMQESKGCVRVKTTTSPDGTVRNPGLMQTHDGDRTCNVIDDTVGAQRMAANGMNLQTNGSTSVGILNPCPDSMINGMIQDGVSGTTAGDGLAGVLNAALAYPAGDCDQPASPPSTSAAAPPAPRQDYPTDSPNGKWCKSGCAPDGFYPSSTSDLGPTGWLTDSPSGGWWNRPHPSFMPSVMTSYITVTAPPSTDTITVTATGIPAPVSNPNTTVSGQVDAQTYYRAARLWNSGQLDIADLGNGFVSTNCFASDIANRLTGWTGKDDQGSCTRCTLDMKKGEPCSWGVCKSLCPKP